MANRIKFKIEHVLILAIILIGIYLLINRCSCNNGFSVGGTDWTKPGFGKRDWNERNYTPDQFENYARSRKLVDCSPLSYDDLINLTEEEKESELYTFKCKKDIVNSYRNESTTVDKPIADWSALRAADWISKVLDLSPSVALNLRVELPLIWAKKPDENLESISNIRLTTILSPIIEMDPKEAAHKVIEARDALIKAGRPTQDEAVIQTCALFGWSPYYDSYYRTDCSNPSKYREILPGNLRDKYVLLNEDDLHSEMIFTNDHHDYLNLSLYDSDLIEYGTFNNRWYELDERQKLYKEGGKLKRPRHALPVWEKYNTKRSDAERDRLRDPKTYTEPPNIAIVFKNETLGLNLVGIDETGQELSNHDQKTSHIMVLASEGVEGKRQFPSLEKLGIPSGYALIGMKPPRPYGWGDWEPMIGLSMKQVFDKINSAGRPLTLSFADAKGISGQVEYSNSSYYEFLDRELKKKVDEGYFNAWATGQSGEEVYSPTDWLEMMFEEEINIKSRLHDALTSARMKLAESCKGQTGACINDLASSVDLTKSVDPNQGLGMSRDNLFFLANTIEEEEEEEMIEEEIARLLLQSKKIEEELKNK